tara:strand:+ start:488 stop:655 length:168 start_codon:yes stop_codon:yes gene_type:complete
MRSNVLILCATTNGPLREIPGNNGAIHVTQKELTVSKDEKERLDGSKSFSTSTGK